MLLVAHLVAFRGIDPQPALPVERGKRVEGAAHTGSNKARSVGDPGFERGLRS